MKKIILIALFVGTMFQLKAQETDPVWKTAESLQLMYRGQLNFSDDLNSYVANGFWHTGAGGSNADPSGAHGTEWQNAVSTLHWPPVITAGILTAERLGSLNWCVQTYRITSYSGNGRFWYRSNWNGAWSAWYEVASTDWAEGHLIKNGTAQQQGDFNVSGTGRLGSYLYFGNNAKIGAPTAAYFGILAPSGGAQNLKVGGITASNNYTDSAPKNGIYVKGNSNFVGNVGIGTVSAEDRLAVGGTIRAQEIKVEAGSSAWPDYVFSPNYPLMPLDILKWQIAEGGHLPGLPYVIQQQEESKKQQALIKEQSALLHDLNERLKLLETSCKPKHLEVSKK